MVRGIGVPERISHGVLQIAEILVEPVYRRQKLIQVAEVLAELPRGEREYRRRWK
jgi:hypothetical protein